MKQNKLKVCIDAGHGQHDPGAIGVNGLKEKDVTLSIALKLGEKLKNNGFEVIYTRTNDNPNFPTNRNKNLAKRVHIANMAQANIFISIHGNSATNRTANGVETFIIDRGGQAENLANNIQNEIIKATKLRNRGVKTANFYVLKYTQMPAILVETAFISNLEEEKLLGNINFQNKIASAIAKGVCDYFNINFKERLINMDNTTKVNLNILGNKTEVDGVFINGRNYVSVRELLEKLGFNVGWDKDSQMVTVDFKLK